MELATPRTLYRRSSSPNRAQTAFGNAIEPTTNLREAERAMVCAAAAEVAELDQPVPTHQEIVHFQIPAVVIHTWFEQPVG